MRVLVIKTINHTAHKIFWKSVGADEWYMRYKNFYLRYFYSLMVDKSYDIYLTENISSLDYLKHNRLFRKKPLIAVVADSLVYVYKYMPRWYFNKHKILRYIHLKEAIDGIKILKGAIVVSNLIKKYLKEFFNGPIEIVRPALDENKLRYLKNIKPNFKSHNIVSIGSGNWKGLPLLIEAFELIKQEYPDAKLYLKCNKNFNECIKLRKIKGITVITKHLSNKEFAKLLSNSHVYVQTSYIDPHPVSVAEAMAAGVIPIVTKMVGTKELFEKTFPSFVTSLSPDDIAKKVIKVFELSECKKNKISKKMKKLSERLSPKKIENDFKKSFNRIVSQL